MKLATAACASLLIGLCGVSCGPRLADEAMARPAHFSTVSRPPSGHGAPLASNARPPAPATAQAPDDADIELVPVDGTKLPARTTPAPSRRYTIRRGDTLAQIAQRFYGSPHLWKVIWKHNRNLIPSPSELQPGTTIVIPERL